MGILYIEGKFSAPVTKLRPANFAGRETGQTEIHFLSEEKEEIIYGKRN